MNTPPLSKGRNNSVRSAKLNLLFVSGPRAEWLCPEAGSAGAARLCSITEKRQSQRTRFLRTPAAHWDQEDLRKNQNLHILWSKTNLNVSITDVYLKS